MFEKEAEEQKVYEPIILEPRPLPTEKPRSNDPYEEKLFIQDHTAESFIELCKQRLCNRTEENTRKFMWAVVEELWTSEEPFLRAVGLCCHPACWWLGNRCPELKGCGQLPKLSDEVRKYYK